MRRMSIGKGMVLAAGLSAALAAPGGCRSVPAPRYYTLDTRPSAITMAHCEASLPARTSLPWRTVNVPTEPVSVARVANAGAVPGLGE